MNLNDEAYAKLGRFLRGDSDPVAPAIDAAFRAILQGDDLDAVAVLSGTVLAIARRSEELRALKQDRSQLRAALLRCLGSQTDEVLGNAIAALEKSDELEQREPTP